MTELQDLFEQTNPIPDGISRCGEGYCRHRFVLHGEADGYEAKFKGFVEGYKHQQGKIDQLNRHIIDRGQLFNAQAQKLSDAEYWIQSMRKELADKHG